MAKRNRFEKVYTQGSIDVMEIWIDTETGVNYLYHQVGYSGGLTPLLDKDGKLPRIRPALLADAIATSGGAILGTSTTTTFVESSSGVAAGGRTGLTSLVTSICFAISIDFAVVSAELLVSVVIIIPPLAKQLIVDNTTITIVSIIDKNFSQYFLLILFNPPYNEN